jgi:probable F420-dependent oxidoreductase
VPALLAVAEATSSLRIGSFVLDNDFRHPVMLAKEVATLDVLSGGRFELGLGAGWQRSEYEQAGISYDAVGTRVSRMEESVHIIKELFTDKAVSFSGTYYNVTDMKGYPRPVQQPHPPLLIGGGGKRVLSFAAKEATIVGIGVKVRADGHGLDARDTLPSVTDQKIAWVREAAGVRFKDLELNVIVFDVMATDDRLPAARRLADRVGGLNAEQALEIPHALIGTEDQICEDLLKRRERYGISYTAIFEEDMDAFEPVLERLAGH